MANGRTLYPWVRLSVTGRALTTFALAQLQARLVDEQLCQPGFRIKTCPSTLTRVKPLRRM